MEFGQLLKHMKILELMGALINMKMDWEVVLVIIQMDVLLQMKLQEKIRNTSVIRKPARTA